MATTYRRNPSQRLAGLTLAGLVTSLTFLAVACTPDDPPDEEATSSPSPTPVAVPTWSPEKPKKPKDMKEKTKEGAESFVRYYYKVFEYARHGEYWTAVKDLSTSDCHMCNVLTRENFSRKYQPEGPAEVNLSDPSVDVEDNTARVAVNRVSAAGTWQANAYEDPRRFKEQEWQDFFFLVYENGRWLVDGIEIHLVDPVKDPTAPYRF